VVGSKNSSSWITFRRTLFVSFFPTTPQLTVWFEAIVPISQYDIQNSEILDPVTFGVSRHNHGPEHIFRVADAFEWQELSDS